MATDGSRGTYGHLNLLWSAMRSRLGPAYLTQNTALGEELRSGQKILLGNLPARRNDRLTIGEGNAARIN